MRGRPHIGWSTKGGPSWSQVRCRVTKDVHGNCLECLHIRGHEEEQELRKPLEGPPRHLVTEFWYEDKKLSQDNEAYNQGSQFIVTQKPGLAIADSGCRSSGGGEVWHEHWQKALKQYQIPWEEALEEETFKFGAGAPIVSSKACIYPVMVHGEPDLIRMSIVGEGASNCPGLIGPGELSRWNAIFHFKDKKIELHGKKQEMRLTATRHPGIELMTFKEEELQRLKEFLNSEKAEEKRKILMDEPQTLAFHSELKSSSEEEEESSEETEKEDMEEHKKEWLKHLQEDLGIKTIPSVDELLEEEEHSSEEDKEEDGKESSSSHEKGIDFITDESSEEEEKEEQAEYRHAYPVNNKTAHKGVRSKLGHTAKEIGSYFREEEERKRKQEKERKRAHEERKRKASEEKFGEEKKRKKKGWTVVEIFTWTCAISIAASLSGWRASEPISLPHWDILKLEDQKEARAYLDQLDPDLMIIAWPCTVWSPLQSFGHKAPWQRQQLELRREEQRRLLGFVRDCSHDQRKRGGLLLGENPKPSLAWKEPLIIEAFDGMGSAVTDMCQFGLRIPGGEALRKRTRLEGTKELVEHCSRICEGKHAHTPVLGGMRYDGRWMNVSDFAGGYTKQFAEAVIKGAEKILSKGRQPEVLVEGEFLPEEEYEEEEEGGEEEEKKGMKQERKENQQWKLVKLHQRLGHPTNKTRAKMLSLSGASKEVVEEALQYHCPSCQETAPPGRYYKAAAEVRTTIFGKEVRCDLKYLHDSKNKLFVALSIVDGATSLHQAVLLRNRDAHHVGCKF